MAQRIRPQSRGGGGTSDAAAAAAAPSTSKRKRVLQDIREEHSCVGVSTRQQSSSVSSSRRSQQAPRRPSPMAPRRSNRNSRRVNAHQAAASTTKTRSSGSSGSSNVSSGSGRRTRSSSSVPRGANTTSGGSGRAAAVSCKQEEAEGEEEGDKDDDDGSMSCDEDLEGMVVDLSFEGVADDGEAEPQAPQRRRRSSTAGAGRCVGAEGAGGKSACGEGGGVGGDPAAAAAAASAAADAAEGGGCADSRRRSKDDSSCSSQPPARPAAAAQQRVGEARKPHAQQQQQEQLPPGVKDIDAGVSEEGESHLLNPDYAKEHALYLREQEKRNRPVAYIGAKQKDMRPSMRSVLVDWICEVCDQFKLSSRTLFQAVDLIDRSLSAFEVPRGKLQLLGCACVVLASKYEEIYAPTAEELAHISDNTYTRAEIIAMELVVVNALQFRLTCITPCNFQDRFCLAAKSNARERSLVSYLLELLLQDYQGVSLLPSLKAAAALYLARQTLHPRGCPREAWTRQTEHYTGYAARELEPCVRRLHYLHVRAEGNNLHAVRDKYKKSALHRVAEVTCALEDYLHFGEEGDVRQ